MGFLTVELKTKPHRFSLKIKTSLVYRLSAGTQAVRNVSIPPYPCIHTGGGDLIWDGGLGPSDCLLRRSYEAYLSEASVWLCAKLPAACRLWSNEIGPLIGFAEVIVSEGKGTGNSKQPVPLSLSLPLSLTHTHTLASTCCWLNSRKSNVSVCVRVWVGDLCTSTSGSFVASSDLLSACVCSRRKKCGYESFLCDWHRECCTDDK